LKHSIASTQIDCSRNENNEKMIHYSSYDVESDSDSTENELLRAVNIVPSEMLCSNSHI